MVWDEPPSETRFEVKKTAEGQSQQSPQFLYYLRVGFSYWFPKGIKCTSYQVSRCHACNKLAACLLARVNQFERVSRWLECVNRVGPTPHRKKTPKCPFKYQKLGLQSRSISKSSKITTICEQPIQTWTPKNTEEDLNQTATWTQAQVNSQKLVGKYWGRARSTSSQTHSLQNTAKIQ